MCEELNRKEFHEAIDTTLSGLQADPWLAQRVVSRERTSEPVMKKKLSFGFVLTIVLILTALTAFALTSGFGLFDFVGTNSKKEIPQNAEQYIMHNLGTMTTDHFTVNIREGYFDGKTIHLIYDIVPESKDMLLLSKGSSTDESWYDVTHLLHDQRQDNENTILDHWNEGGYTSIWSTDITVEMDEKALYSENTVLNEETGILTGHVQISFNQLKTERTIILNFQAAQLIDAHDKSSVDYDYKDFQTFSLTFHAAYSGEERILCNEEPILLESVGAQIDHIRLTVFPNEIQYQINYSIINDGEYTSPESLSFRFVELNENRTINRYLNEGISDQFWGVDSWISVGYLGHSEIYDEYTLAVYKNSLEDPLEFVTVQLKVDNNWTWTPEERVWQQESERLNSYNVSDDTFVNSTSEDLPEDEAVAIAKKAILEAYNLPNNALENGRVVTNLYVTNARPTYRRWFVQFHIFKEESSSYVEQFYNCIVDQKGMVIADPDINEPSLEEKVELLTASRQNNQDKPAYFKRYLEYIAQNGNQPFYRWPYEQKAAYSYEMQELTREYESIERDISMTITYVYGLPEKNELEYSDAVVIAQQALTNKDIDTSNLIILSESFDISHKLYIDNVWKFVFVNSEDWYGPRYRIVLNSKDGAVIEIEKFNWQELLQNQEYDLKLY